MMKGYTELALELHSRAVPSSEASPLGAQSVLTQGEIPEKGGTGRKKYN